MCEECGNKGRVCGESQEIKNITEIEDVVPVVCCVFPDGTTFWLKAEKTGKETRERAKDIISQWNEANPEYVNTKCTLGFVEIWMPREKYYSLQADNRRNW